MDSTTSQVILLEPTPLDALLTAAHLSALGCELHLGHTSTDGRALVDTLLQTDAPLALILINITSDDGFDLASELTDRMAVGRLPYVPIIALAPGRRVEDEAAAQAAGCLCLLRTPILAGGAQLVQRLVPALHRQRSPLISSTSDGERLLARRAA
jgi:CheY-like chemotaxis protein